jgi:hypothetical protein
MTSRRRETTVLAAGFACLLTLLGGCASVPDDSPVVEKLDTETGFTVARLGRPLELYRETGGRDNSDKFAFFGPFETNQMGARAQYLWIAVPSEPGDNDPAPVVELDGKPLELGSPGRGADFAGLVKSPYRIPTPWSAMYYFKVDAGIIAKVGAALDVGIRYAEPTRDGPVQAHYSVKIGDARLQDFAAR